MDEKPMKKSAKHKLYTVLYVLLIATTACAVPGLGGAEIEPTCS